MKRTAFISVAAGALLVAVPAMSEPGVQLAWDDCRNGGGSSSRTFACDTNAGSHTLVLSVTAPAGIERWVAFEAAIALQFTAPQPEWWKLRNQAGQANQCRNGALSANALGAGLSGCTDRYSGNVGGGIGTYQNGPNIPPSEMGGPHPNRARLILVFALPLGSEAPLTADETYFVAKVVITNAKTVGADACPGCQTSACITLNRVRVVQPAGAPGGDPDLYGSEFNGSMVFWRSAEYDLCDGCHDHKNSTTTCAICPPKAVTWGGIKSLYR